MKKVSILLIGLLTAVITFAILISAVKYGLAPCDDYSYVATHKQIINGCSFATLPWVFSHLGDGIWMPFTWVSYQLDYTIASLFGLTSVPELMHIHSVTVHSLNASLFFTLLLILSPYISSEGRRFSFVSASVISSFFWALHPLRVESVVWIASRKDVWSMFFELIAVLLWVKFRTASSCRTKTLAYIVSMLCVVLSSMAKPSILTFPALVAIIDFFFIRCVQIFRQSDGKFNAKIIVPYLIPAAYGLGIAVLATIAQQSGGAFSLSDRVPLYGKIITACAAFGIYFFNTVFPLDLAVDCVQKWPILPRFTLPGCVVTALVATYLCKRFFELRKNNFTPGRGWILLPGLLWFSAAIVPFTANFGIHASADRFTYVPSLGFSLIMLSYLLNSRLKKIALITGVASLIILGILTRRQISFWRDDFSLYQQTLDVDGDDNDRAHLILAMSYWEYTHNLEKCIEHMDKAYQLKPDNAADFLHIYIMALSELGKGEKAHKLLKKLIDINQRKIDAVTSRGMFITDRSLTLSLHFARAAYYLTDKKLLPLVQDEIDAIERKKKDYILGYYLRYRLALVKGNNIEAEQHRKDLLSKGSGEPYLRCRFLTTTN